MHSIWCTPKFENLAYLGKFSYFYCKLPCIAVTFLYNSMVIWCIFLEKIKSFELTLIFILIATVASMFATSEV